jgi:hypothetical protein
MEATIDGILDEIARMPIEDQELVDGIVHKRIIEGKREAIRADYLAAMEERKHGRIMSGSAADLYGTI